MRASESDALHQRLANDPELRKEFEGYREFVNTLCTCGGSECVPCARLDTILSDVVYSETKRRKLTLFPTYVIAAAATFAVFFGVGFSLLSKARSESTPVANVLQHEFHDPVQAAAWVRTHTSGVTAPVVALANHRDCICSAHSGGNWACFDFNVHGDIVCLKMLCGTTPIQGQEVDCKGKKVFQSSEGLSWRQNNTVYVVRGDSRSAVEDVIQAVRKSL